MPSWKDVSASAPELAAEVAALFTSHRHHTMATVRADGGPRISGTELSFDDGELALGIMAGAVRIRDLARDPRVALHSHSIDPREDDPSAWPGEAKVAGRAVPVADGGTEAGTEQEDGIAYRIDVTEVVLTKVGSPADHLLILAWHPDRGVTRIERR